MRGGDPMLPMRQLHAIRKLRLAGAGLLLLPLLGACGRPDSRGLQVLACQQAAASLDMRSVTQLDALRKLLGVAPDVDPLSVCRELGVTLDPVQPAPSDPSGSERPASD